MDNNLYTLTIEYVLFNKPRNTLNISLQYINSMKKQVYKLLEDQVNLWDFNVNGVLLKVSEIKLKSGHVELKSTADYISVPVCYKALYFIPKSGVQICKYDILMFIDAEIGQVLTNGLKATTMGIIDVEVAEVPKGKKKLEVGAIVKLNYSAHYVRSDRIVILECTFDK
jgi:hypothetical protein